MKKKFSSNIFKKYLFLFGYLKEKQEKKPSREGKMKKTM